MDLLAAVDDAAGAAGVEADDPLHRRDPRVEGGVEEAPRHLREGIVYSLAVSPPPPLSSSSIRSAKSPVRGHRIFARHLASSSPLLSALCSPPPPPPLSILHTHTHTHPHTHTHTHRGTGTDTHVRGRAARIPTTLRIGERDKLERESLRWAGRGERRRRKVAERASERDRETGRWSSEGYREQERLVATEMQ